MTEKKLGKLKRTLVFLLTALMSLSLLFAVACGNDKNSSTSSDQTYTKVENDEQALKNGNFEFGTADAELDDYPYTSLTGWSKSIDNSASSSNVNSGIIDTSTAAWDELIATLSENETFLKWAGKEKADKNDEDAVNALINELKTKIANPGVHENAQGSKVFMLNNYNKDLIGKGVAQKLTSSTTFTLKPSTYGKLTVWVKTANLSANAGANIRVVSTVAGITQDEYAIDGIIADEWTKYTITVKANDRATTTVKLVLGLGYGNGSTELTGDYCEGTVYFDDASYEELETASTEGLTTANVSLVAKTSSERKPFESSSSNDYFLDFSFAPMALSDLTGLSVETEMTESNTGVSNAPSDARLIESTKNDKYGFSVKQERASTTTIVKAATNNFIVASGDYAQISFYLSMNVDKLQKNGLTVWLFDVNGDAVREQKVLDNVTVEEKTYYVITVNNNFTSGEREFYLAFVFGPNDVYTESDQTAYVTGSYEVTDLKNTAGDIEEKENDAVYTILSKTDNVSEYALYAGSESDYSETEESESYNLSVAYSDKGAIETRPAKVSGYKGIADYGTSDATNADVKSGLINSKYVDAYGEEIKNALDYTGTENIQPLMIYNAQATSYGYVKTDALTLSANSSATLSVKVKVNAGAKAYVYLIDTSRGDGYLEPITQKFGEYTNKTVIKVEDTQGEWVTVKFYVASGKDAISYRLEMWNGERVNAQSNAEVTKSQGYVFFDEITTGSTFTVTDVIASANKGEIDGFDYINQNLTTVKYTQALNENEIKWNNENPDDKISYKESVVYATDTENRLMLVSFASINPIENNPYAETEDDTEEGTTSTGCANVDASALALSISSLVLAIALVAAIVAVIVKGILRKAKKNKRDAKSHYKVTSRNKTQSAIKAKANAKLDEDEELEEIDETEENAAEEYTYGEVLEDFGDDENEVSEETSTEKNEDK